MTRWLYLARHGDAAEGGGLTRAGRQQAELLARRLSTVPLTEVVHSPEQRAVETAAALARPAEQWAAAGDYVPYAPADHGGFLDGCTDAELSAGARWAAEALARFATPRKPTATTSSSRTPSWSRGSSATPWAHPRSAGSASTPPTAP
ncbi:histidine phosphatase family protein [Actinoplanes sp. N902-109]|uniref:histidine phosphatase family protein n=1 Tax=Actinoplanes sp. (strain N902-109) TaxID=649831 RepID=UPI0003293B25|nr:histidine phosphatase family protein [Actinoplanes sp. N902-109]AGL15108.1 pgam5; phosphoglycerate mutase family member 5 [Actinoplanes sp. N902-109]